MRASGRLLFYSTSRTNRSSQRVAARLDLPRIGYLWQLRSMRSAAGWADPRVRACQSTIEGNGLYASERIAAGEVVFVWGGGAIISDAELLELPHLVDATAARPSAKTSTSCGAPMTQLPADLAVPITPVIRICGCWMRVLWARAATLPLAKSSHSTTHYSALHPNGGWSAIAAMRSVVGS